MEQITSPNHFQTQDRQLMRALLMAGCKLAPQAEGGPARITYTPELLRQHGFLPVSAVSPLVFENASREAYACRMPGPTAYYIIRDECFQRAIKAWDAMVDTFTLAKSGGYPPKLPDIDEVTAMQVAYMLRQAESKLKDIAFCNEPILCIKHARSHEEDVTKGGAPLPGKREVTTGSGIFWSWNLNPTAKAELWSKLSRK